MPFMTNWIMVNVAHGSPTMNSSTPWPYNASRKAAPGWGLPQIIQVMDGHFSTETMLKPMVTWGSAIFQDNIYIYISIIIYPTKIIGFMWPRLGPIQQAVLIVNMLLAHNTRMKYLFPKSVSYVQRAGKRLNANNCSCTAICPNKVYPNILLEYPKRTNATIREGGKHLSANIHWYIDILTTYILHDVSIIFMFHLSLSISSINNFPSFSFLSLGAPAALGCDLAGIHHLASQAKPGWAVEPAKSCTSWW